MNEELKKKIEDIKNNEKAATGKNIEDLIKQGYKKEDIQEILSNTGFGSEFTRRDIEMTWFIKIFLFLNIFLCILFLIYDPAASLIWESLIISSIVALLGVFINKIWGYILTLLVVIFSSIILFMLWAVTSMSNSVTVGSKVYWLGYAFYIHPILLVAVLIFSIKIISKLMKKNN